MGKWGWCQATDALNKARPIGKQAINDYLKSLISGTKEKYWNYGSQRNHLHVYAVGDTTFTGDFFAKKLSLQKHQILQVLMNTFLKCNYEMISLMIFLHIDLSTEVKS